MAATPPPTQPAYAVPPIPRLPTPSRRSMHARGSIGSSFSFGPGPLVSYIDAHQRSFRSNPSLDPNRSVLPASPRNRRRVRHAPEDVTADGYEGEREGEGDEEEEEEFEWDMLDRMRLWRHDALMQHLYETAAFWGDKILSWTNDPNDAFWLGQIYFSTNQFSRAERLLTRPFPTSPPASPTTTTPLTNGHADTKGKGREDALLDAERLPLGIDAPERTSRLVDLSVACRYLAAQCQVRMGNWADATEMLGEANPFSGSGRSGPDIANVDGGIKVESSMCHLRGVLMQKLGRAAQAKACFMEALALDVKNYDSFEMLISGEMLSVDEEWDFVQTLAYTTQTPEDADFIRLMYTARLRKYKHAAEHALTRRRLADEFGLGDNPDVLHAFADALYVQFRWADCFVITSRILSLTAVHNPTMPLHIACMYHMQRLHASLFILAHELVEREPEAAASWYAVGVWYLAQGRWTQARQYFSKTSLMDPRFGPAWIAFAHTFALEGEHDHAVTAYSTCSRMFAGSHLPLMFVGMEQLMLSNHALASEALNAASTLCEADPLLLNERGVLAFSLGEFGEAATMFQQSLDVAQVTQASQASWATTYLNLGTCHRKLGRLEEAKATFQKVLEIEPRHAQALASLGLVLHLLKDVDKAIVKYHEALSVDPLNPHALELLNLALESQSLGGPKVHFPGGSDGVEKMMKSLHAKLRALKASKQGQDKDGAGGLAGLGPQQGDAGVQEKDGMQDVDELMSVE